MYDFLEDILEDAPDDMDGTNTRTPAKSNIFTVDHDSPLLSVPFINSPSAVCCKEIKTGYTSGSGLFIYQGESTESIRLC